MLILLTNPLERKSQEFETTSKAIKGQSSLLDLETRSFLSTVEVFMKNAEQSLTKTKSRVESFQKKEMPALAAHRQSLDEQIKRIAGAVKTIQSKEDASEQNLMNIWTIVKEVQDRLANELSMWSGSAQNDIQVMCADIEQAASVNFAAVSAIFTLWLHVIYGLE